jgi:hypothetical protein
MMRIFTTEFDSDQRKVKEDGTFDCYQTTARQSFSSNDCSTTNSSAACGGSAGGGDSSSSNKQLIQEIWFNNFTTGKFWSKKLFEAGKTVVTERKSHGEPILTTTKDAESTLLEFNLDGLTWSECVTKRKSPLTLTSAKASQ